MFFNNKIFISYSSFRVGDAKVVREFFTNNNFKVVMDIDEKENYIHFMDRINECKYVIMILNNSFFESPYCIYEVIDCLSKRKKIFPIYLNKLEIENRKERRNYYDKLIYQSNYMNVLSKDRKKFDEAIDSFDKYDDIVNRILAIVRYPEREKSLRNACNEIYFKIKKKNAKKTWIENEFEIRSSYLSEMEKITENYSDFIYNYYQYKNGFAPQYILGTDSQGYDLALRLADGIKLSLLVAVCVSVVNFIIGAAYGAIEGYYGGTVDIVLERVTDVLSGVPFIIVATLFQLHLASKLGPVACLIFAYVLTGWIGTASRVRTQFYRFKNSEYVMAARTLGAKDRRLIWKHIFPNSLGTIVTSAALSIPSVINSESMLSYLGIVKLGTASTTSLGNLLAEAQGIWTNYPHLMICPALVLSLLMICFNLFGNGLRDAFNPSLRGVEE